MCPSIGQALSSIARDPVSVEFQLCPSRRPLEPILSILYT